MSQFETRTGQSWPTPPDPLLTIEEVAEYTRLSVPALRAKIHNGTAPRSARFARKRMWRQSDVQKWLDEQFENAA